MRVLVAVDGSKYSDLAIEHCKEFCFPKNTHIQVFSVQDPNTLFLSEKDIDQIKEYYQKIVDGHVNNLKAENPALKVTGKVLSGLAKQQILNECNDFNADLIVLGTHGRTAIGRFLVGSVSQTVLNHAPCSVRIVRERQLDSTGGDILIAADNSHCTEMAIERVKMYNWPKGTKFVICTVVPDFAGQVSVDPYGTFGTYLPELNEQGQKSAEELANKIESQLKNSLDAPEIEKVTPIGDAREKLITLAESRACEMIFCGSHNLGLLDRVVIGSVSEAVAVHATATVEVVRDPMKVKAKDAPMVHATSME